MKESNWKRFMLIEKVISFAPVMGLAFYEINVKYLHCLPNLVTSNLFFVLLGIFLGFLVCKFEFKRVLTKK